MNARMNIDPTTQATVTGYAARPVTNPPDWHGLVTLDVLFNNLSAGLFLVAGLVELVTPSFTELARMAYPIALLWLIADLICLVLDLGDSLRFHHMLRVWKPSSPMSFGTWCITAYAVPLTVLTTMSFFPAGGAALEWIRRLMLIVGLVLALGTAVYKGVLFSTTAQPGWSDARWLGAYLSSSALVLGTAQLLFLASVMARPDAVAALRPALMLLLPLNLVALSLLVTDLRAPLSRAHRPPALVVIGALTLVAGSLAPLWLLAQGAAPRSAGVLLLIGLGAAVVRHEIVRLPHLLADANTG